MELVNRTPAEAQIFTTVADEDRMLAAVVLRQTFRLEGGALVPDPERPFPVAAQEVKTDFGVFEPEVPFPHEGYDVYLLGKAYPPSPRATAATVRLQIEGALDRSILVFGDRRWVRRDGRLVPGPPTPTQPTPLTLPFAYGGKIPVETGEFPHPANPFGRGFYGSEEAAEGNLLPNLEDPAHPVRTWQDQPQPVCTGPIHAESALRTERAAEYDTSVNPPRIRRIRRAKFDGAHPWLLLPHAPTPGASVRATGVRPDGEELAFALTDVPSHVHVQLADRQYVFPTAPECLILLAEERRVVLGHRCCFRYRLVPRERRAAVLYAGPALGAPPPGYTIDWPTFDRELEAARG